MIRMDSEMKRTTASAQPDGAEMVDAARTAEACAAESLTRLSDDTQTHRDCADIYPEYKAAVELLSGGTNTVILDDAGMPSVMVRIGRMMLSGLMDGASGAIHPAFMISGAPVDCIYYSKYQNIVRNGRAYSLPMQDPQTYVSFGEARDACASKGRGWGLTPFSLRAALALWAKKNGTLPRGNSFSGRDYFRREETGIPTTDGRVATGSGPNAWAHNGKPDGIWDLNGNMNEWDAGMRLLDGEIQIIPGSDCMLPSADLSFDSRMWRSILPDGTLAEPGTEGALHYHGNNGGIQLTASRATAEPSNSNCAFQCITAADGLAVPEIIKALMLFPEAPDIQYDGWRWVNPVGERLPLCGGAHKALDHAGIFFVGLTYPRGHKYELSGFRSAYVPLPLE